jgi:excisionase family DNA binding protein
MGRMASDLSDAEVFLTRAQVAELFNVSPSTVTRWADEGKLICVKTLGGHRRYQREDIVELVQMLKKEERMEVVTVEIPRMYGDHHATAVRQALAKLPGVQNVWTSAALCKLQVTFDPELVSSRAIMTQLADVGYPAKDGPLIRSGELAKKDPAWAQLGLRMTQTHLAER